MKFLSFLLGLASMNDEFWTPNRAVWKTRRQGPVRWSYLKMIFLLFMNSIKRIKTANSDVLWLVWISRGCVQGFPTRHYYWNLLTCVPYIQYIYIHTIVQSCIIQIYSFLWSRVTFYAFLDTDGHRQDLRDKHNDKAQCRGERGLRRLMTGYCDDGHVWVFDEYPLVNVYTTMERSIIFNG